VVRSPVDADEGGAAIDVEARKVGIIEHGSTAAPDHHHTRKDRKLFGDHGNSPDSVCIFVDSHRSAGQRQCAEP
jgi:hypothetical protein